jgi:hypothetical protein
LNVLRNTILSCLPTKKQKKIQGDKVQKMKLILNLQQ